MKVNKQQDIYKNLKIFHFSDVLLKTVGKGTRGVIFGSFGSKNAGDDAILAGQLAELKKTKWKELTIIARYPKLVEKHPRIKVVSYFDLTKIVYTIIRAEYVIFGGGGLICKNRAGIKGIIFQLYMLLLFLLFPLLLRKNVYALGIGVYSNTNVFVKYIALFLLQYVSLLTVRDHHSYEQVKGIKHARFYKDNSFLLPVLSKSSVKKHHFFQEKYDKNHTNIAFALKAPDTADESSMLHTSVKRFIKKQKTASTFWFYSLDSHGYASGDMRFIDEILSDPDLKKFTLIVVPNNLPAVLTFSSFQLMDLVIASRFHGMVYSYRTKTPFIGIPYDAKCSSFLTSIGKTMNNIIQLGRMKVAHLA
jgi:polysaccharide pyruvyl transferase WcaK-like protein